MTDSAALSMRVPADPSSVGVARRFAADLSRHASLPDEAVADVALAVSEACSAIVALRDVAPANGRIAIDASLDDALALDIRDEGEGFLPRPGYTPGAPARVGELDTARLDLIRALFPDVVIGTTEGGRLAVRFSTTLPAPLGDGGQQPDRAP